MYPCSENNNNERIENMEKLRKIALLTDSCADLAAETARENNIYVVPLRILCTDGEYRDGVDITSGDIYGRLEGGELPKTSLPSEEDVTRTLDKIADDGFDSVIAVMLSGGLSGTFNLVRLVAQERDDLCIRVFDSLSGSLGQGMILLQLAQEIKNGAEWEYLVEERVTQLIKNTFPFFSVDTLEYLRKGGRIGNITAVAGALLQIKPVISFGEDGQLRTAAKVRGQRHVAQKLVELTQSLSGEGRKYNLAVANGGLPEEMARLREMLIEELPEYSNIWSGEIGGTLSAHIGRGILGAAVQLL